MDSRSAIKVQFMKEYARKDFQAITVKDAALDVFDYTLENKLPVDILINNAGFGDSGSFADRDWQKQYEMIQVNIVALMKLTHCFLKPMMRQGKTRERVLKFCYSITSISETCFLGDCLPYVFTGKRMGNNTPSRIIILADLVPYIRTPPRCRCVPRLCLALMDCEAIHCS